MDNQEYKEKVALIEEDGQMKISNQGYIGKSTFSNVTGEDQNIKISILNKNMSYEREEYEVEITNKTDGYVLIGNGNLANEVTLNLGDQSRPALGIVNQQYAISTGANL